jgi:hypothetical protein
LGLYLIETATGAVARDEVDGLLARLVPAVTTVGAEVVESRVTADLKRLFTIVEVADSDPPRTEVADSDPPRTEVTDADGLGAGGADAERLRAGLAAAGVEVDDVAAVRLVGADLDEVKAATGEGPRYLVEWDLPSELTMDTYLARKREKSPLYAEIPEVAFRRTYVREDLDKCLCFYDAPCADDVYRARDVVSAPVDRFHELS